jgi:hypothetical protein
MKTTMPSLYPVMEILVDTHDNKTFRSGLPADATLGMFPGDYLYVATDGKAVKGSYAPSGLLGATGFFALTVERNGHHPKYLPDQGVMTQC